MPPIAKVRAIHPSIHRISSGCQVLAGKEYLIRLNNLAMIVNQALTSLHSMIAYEVTMSINGLIPNNTIILSVEKLKLPKKY